MKKNSSGSSSPRRADLPNKVRIIGGRWRGTRVEFPSLAAVRPSPDRVRETLFNWLQASLPGARCLDLFAGSGVLGLEALSRGAGEVVFVDRDPSVARYIRLTLERLQAADLATVECVDASAYLRRRAENADAAAITLVPGPDDRSRGSSRDGRSLPEGVQPPAFDMVFLDPPFSMGLLPKICELLVRRRWLAVGAHVYMESEFAGPPELPAGYKLLRSKRAGQVGYHLATWTREAGPGDESGPALIR